MSTAENSLGWKKENRGFDMNRPFATIVIIHFYYLIYKVQICSDAEAMARC